jgi:hypothetical protein
MIFTGVKSITIPEGSVKKITAGGVVLWEKPKGITNIIDTVGYTDDKRLSTSDGVSWRDLAGYTTTGMFDIPAGSTVRTKGVNFNTTLYSNAMIYNYNMNTGAFVTAYRTNNINLSFISITLDNDGNLTMTVSYAIKCRLCGYGSGANLIVTINEEIT